MAKVCIILNSLYDRGHPHFFNAEVQQDLSIVRDTLKDHQLLEINLPVNAGNMLIKKIIRQMLNLIDIHESTECHIVLNTHGSPGFSDLKHESIVFLLDTLSRMQVTITQISGLQCDGMKKFEGVGTSLDPYKILMTDVEKKIYREASLVTLQKKLSSLTLDKKQSFKIHGFKFAYNPFEHQSAVIKVLEGTQEHQLDVSIKSFQFTKDYFNQVLENLTLLSKYQQLSSKEYQHLANFFAKLQKYMKQHLLIAVEKKQEINPLSPLWTLRQALNAHANAHMKALQLDNPHHMEAIYKNWLKTYKLYSAERLEVLHQFATISIENISSERSHSLGLPSKK